MPSISQLPSHTKMPSAAACLSTTQQTPPSNPTISASTLLAATSHDLAMLHDILSLLNQLFARNRNQHSRAHWWKSLFAFRKQLGLLLQGLESDGGKGSGKGVGKASGKRADREKEKEEKVTARLRYWDKKCVHGWY